MPAWKRSFDIVFVLAAMPLLGICVLTIAVLHRLCSPGPVFFTQVRIGRDGRCFRLYKFRTMVTAANPIAHVAHFSELIATDIPMVKMDSQGDSRLIPGGWLVRAAGLDELPQLINVLKGEMSLVGPRPCLPYEYEQYQPWQRERLKAVPGLTGLWQVSGKNRTTFSEMIRLDVEYANTRSPWLDAKIILMTIPALLRQIHDVRDARSSPRRIAANQRPTAFVSNRPNSISRTTEIQKLL